jgi:hypothetical protein
VDRALEQKGKHPSRGELGCDPGGAGVRFFMRQPGSWGPFGPSRPAGEMNFQRLPNQSMARRKVPASEPTWKGPQGWHTGALSAAGAQSGNGETAWLHKAPYLLRWIGDHQAEAGRIVLQLNNFQTCQAS